MHAVCSVQTQLNVLGNIPSILYFYTCWNMWLYWSVSWVHIVLTGPSQLQYLNKCFACPTNQLFCCCESINSESLASFRSSESLQGWHLYDCDGAISNTPLTICCCDSCYVAATAQYRIWIVTVVLAVYSRTLALKINCEARVAKFVYNLRVLTFTSADHWRIYCSPSDGMKVLSKKNFHSLFCGLSWLSGWCRLIVTFSML